MNYKEILNNVQDQVLANKEDIDSIKYDPSIKDVSEELAPPEVTLQWRSLIAAPPKNSSLQTKKEMELIAKRSKVRTKAEEKQVMINDKEVLDLFEPFIKKHDLKFDRKELERYDNIRKKVTALLKKFYNRPRPEQLSKHYDLDINVLETKTHATPAYPSGHAAIGYLVAEYLSDKYPEHRKQLFMIADNAGFLRVIQGVHYPSDSVASKEMISKLYKNVKKNIEKTKD